MEKCIDILKLLERSNLHLNNSLPPSFLSENLGQEAHFTTGFLKESFTKYVIILN